MVLEFFLCVQAAKQGTLHSTRHILSTHCEPSTLDRGPGTRGRDVYHTLLFGASVQLGKENRRIPLGKKLYNTARR